MSSTPPSIARAWPRGRKLFRRGALAALLAPLCLGPARAAGPAHTEIPISETRLSDGTVRFSLPVRIGDTPVQAMLDTGSLGLRVLAAVLPPAQFIATGVVRDYGYSSGVVLHGELARAMIGLGSTRTSGPVLIQVVDDVRCMPTRPRCPAARVSPGDYRIGGEGLPRQGFTAIIGISMRTPNVAMAARNPLGALGARGWIVILPLPGDTAPGKLILNPTPQEQAGFRMLQLPRGRAGDVLDNALPGCPDRQQGCAPTPLDTGAPEGVRPFYAYAVLYDPARGAIGLRRRR